MVCPKESITPPLSKIVKLKPPHKHQRLKRKDPRKGNGEVERMLGLDLRRGKEKRWLKGRVLLGLALAQGLEGVGGIGRM